MTVTVCPSKDRLQAFYLGRLSDAEIDDLKGHLDSCLVCQESLQSDVPNGDTFIKELKQVAPAPAFLREPQCANAVARSAALVDDPHGTVIPPQRVGRYTGLVFVAEGGQGVVYRARDEQLGRPVAVKVLRLAGGWNPAARDRFDRERRALDQLDHPNLVRAFDAGELNGDPFLVMEWVDGSTLSQVVKERGPLPVAEACGYARQAALALLHAHENGLVHRDVKPSNLMLAATGQVKVLDLGLARLLHGSEANDVTTAGQVMGTADYMAPEQAEDARQADHRSDIYSLGCTLYYLLGGQPPFPKRSVLNTLKAHRDEKPQPLRGLRPEVPGTLAAVIARVMAKNPANRFANMAEVADALAPFARPTALPEAPSPGVHRFRGWRRLITPALLAGILLGSVLLIAGVVVKLRTAEGTLEVSVMEDDVEVIVDEGKEVVIRDKAGTTTLAPGGHKVAVKRGDETMYTESFELEKGGRKTIRAKWTPKDQAPEPTNLKLELPGPGKSVPGLERFALSRDGKQMLISSTADYKAYLYDRSGKNLQTLDPDSRAGFYVVAFSNEGGMALLGGEHWQPVIWDLKKKKPWKRLGEGGTKEVILSGAFLPGDKEVLLGHRVVHNGATTIRRWNIESGKEVMSYPGHMGYVDSISVSANGRRFASSGRSDRTARVWDVESGKEIGRHTHLEHVPAAAISPDGKLVASAGNDRKVRLWNSEGIDDTPLREGPAQDENLVTVKFSQDGKLLASGDLLRVIVWDVAAWKKLAEWPLRSAPAGLAFDSDNRLVIAERDGTIVTKRVPLTPREDK